jgi:hypothetical protein
LRVGWVENLNLNRDRRWYGSIKEVGLNYQHVAVFGVVIAGFINDVAIQGSWSRLRVET